MRHDNFFFQVYFHAAFNRKFCNSVCEKRTFATNDTYNLNLNQIKALEDSDEQKIESEMSETAEKFELSRPDCLDDQN